ncbi:hypothetical protein PROFUN_08826 [Planoprotostelium fungivorum]|uniref:Protein HIRA n=1 Tax=Planoprotostelium fungivorum TaxID=1890364 RepID=A0A2P6MXE3_9EUKA|nr:hypothetical protein PROFUN_15297 [Planoprotostelium fungivorum]PRP83889.1 hypothetical protein PROFUN_08826 [Planoprotostelium fungivorum]
MSKVLVAKPPWVKHSGEPIYSCDIHPDGKRFVTAGGDNKIKIWSFPALVSTAIEPDYSGPTLLALIESHTLPVNVCRWSPDGKYLATASDDKSVLVFELSTQHSLRVYGSDEQQHEQWKIRAQFLGHTADVLDLSWSPSSDLLVSGSVDNNVIVWNLNTKTQEAILKGHQSFVRGVCWDPIGRYIVSQSEDKQVRVWRTTDWQLEASIDKPFEKTKQQPVMFQRMSWSPEGGIIACCSGSFTILLNRGSWDMKVEFVGHTNSVTCTRFNHRVFVKGGAEVLYCSAGSSDCGISVWSTATMRAAAVIKPVLDSAWSPDGKHLVSVSSDGTAAVLIFPDDFLGQAMGAKETEEMMRKLYGGYNITARPQLAETPFQLETEKSPEPKAAEPNRPTIVVNTDNMKKQREIVQGGKRRIVPVFLSPNKSPPAPTLAPKSSAVTPKLTPSTAPAPPTPSTPMTSQKPHLQPAKSPTAVPNPFATPAVVNVEKSSPVKEKTHGNITSDGGDGMVVEEREKTKRKLTEISDDTPETPTKKSKTKEKKDKVKDKAKEKGKEKEKPREKKEETNTAQPPKINPTTAPDRLSIEIGTSKFALGQMSQVVTVEADHTGRIAAYAGRQLWEDFLKKKITHLVGNFKFIAAGCEGGLLYLYSYNGRYILPSIQLSDSIAFLERSEEHLLFVITCDGQCHLYDLSREACVFDAPLPHSLLSAGLRAARITEKGKAVISDEKFSEAETRTTLPMATRGILSSIQATSQRHARISDNSSQEKNSQSIYYLEHQMASSILLESPNEYKEWLKSYVRRLTAEGAEAKLNELFLSNSSESMDAKILNMTRRDLLKEMLSIVSQNRSLQRLCNNIREVIHRVE